MVGVLVSCIGTLISCCGLRYLAGTPTQHLR